MELPQTRRSSIGGPRASILEPSEPDRANHAEVIVVGAGPGGSAAAAFCARQGLDVLLLEKSGFPREKVCGDGLTPRAVRMLTRLGIDTSASAGWQHSRGLRVYGGRRGPFEFPWPVLTEFPGYGLVCPRSVFDDLLAGTAAAAGARLYTGVKVTDAIRHDRSGRVIGVTDARGRSYRAPVVIAADGSSARLALKVGRERHPGRPMGVAVRSYYTSPRHDMAWLESWLELWDGRPGDSNLLPGYGWIFPLGDGTVNAGLGMLNTSTVFAKTDYRQLMRRWLDGTPEEWGYREANRLEPIRGAALPMAFDRGPLYADGLLLVGDAAGMVSPFNGEGISYAMEAAEIAARQVADARARGFGSRGAELALRGYQSAMRAEWGGYFRLGTIFVKLIGNPRIMRLCTNHGLPRPGLMRLVNKLLAHLTDTRGGDFADRIINLLTRFVPSA